VDKEVRHGVDAVRLTIRLSSTSLVDLLWLAQQSGPDNGGVARLQTNFFGYDFSVSMAKYVSDIVAGADFAGDLGVIALHGEAAYTWGLNGLGSGTPITVGDKYLRAVAGADWKPVTDVFVSAEYYFNGFGASDASGYIAKLTSPRETSGQVFGAGRHYLGVGVTWKATDLLSINASAIVNLQDPSVIIVPAVEYWFEQSVIVRAGAYAPVGRPPDPSLAATSPFGLQSEYGISPLGIFVEVGIYL